MPIYRKLRDRPRQSCWAALLNAGIGWGGSCFGKDTAALISTAGEYGLDMPIVKAARQVNYHQREWVVERLQDELKIQRDAPSHYRDLRSKPTLMTCVMLPRWIISRYLIQRGVKARAHDPVALENARKLYPHLGVHYFDDVHEAIDGADALVLVTEWPEYRKLPWKDIINKVSVLDGRNFLPGQELSSLGSATLALTIIYYLTQTDKPASLPAFLYLVFPRYL